MAAVAVYKDTVESSEMNATSATTLNSRRSLHVACSLTEEEWICSKEC